MEFYSIPCARKKFFGARGATSFLQNLKLDKDEFETFGASGGGEGEGGGWMSRFEPAAPLACSCHGPSWQL